MSKKSFKDDNPALAFIGTQREEEELEGQIEVTQDVPDAPVKRKTTKARQVKSKADKEKTPSTQDTQEVQQKPKAPATQGKKGQKLQRINMAFSDENIEYLRLISRLEGISMTQYVNTLLEADRVDRADLIEQAKKLLK